MHCLPAEFYQPDGTRSSSDEIVRFNLGRMGIFSESADQKREDNFLFQDHIPGGRGTTGWIRVPLVAGTMPTKPSDAAGRFAFLLAGCLPGNSPAAGRLLGSGPPFARRRSGLPSLAGCGGRSPARPPPASANRPPTPHCGSSSASAGGRSAPAGRGAPRRGRIASTTRYSLRPACSRKRTLPELTACNTQCIPSP
jgi:hypothetical protein